MAKVTTPITKRSREQHLTDLHTSLIELESSRDNLFTCGLEPGQVGFICGPGGQGKSFLTTQDFYKTNFLYFFVNLLLLHF